MGGWDENEKMMGSESEDHWSRVLQEGLWGEARKCGGFGLGQDTVSQGQYQERSNSISTKDGA